MLAVRGELVRALREVERVLLQARTDEEIAFALDILRALPDLACDDRVTLPPSLGEANSLLAAARTRLSRIQERKLPRKANDGPPHSR